MHVYSENVFHTDITLQRARMLDAVQPDDSRRNNNDQDETESASLEDFYLRAEGKTWGTI